MSGLGIKKSRPSQTFGSVDRETILTVGTFFKVMGDETRLRILTSLLDGSLCVKHISERVGMSQSAISHQLAVLRQADLVRVARNGKQLIYSISDEHVRLMLDMALLHVKEREEI